MATCEPTKISREQIDVFSGGLSWLPKTISDDSLAMLVNACELRVLHMMCRECAPDSKDANYSLWLMMLANWVKTVYLVNRSGVEHITAESMRNFSISRGNNGDVLIKDFYANFSDIIGLFSKCKSSVQGQGDWTALIYAPDALRIEDIMPDAPPMLGGAI